MVETVKPGLMVIVNACVADCCGLLLSVTLMVKLAVPATVGVPPIAPVLGFSVSPAGSVPGLIDQL